MFVGKFKEKLRTASNRERAEKFAAAQYATAAEGIRNAVPGWRSVHSPTPAIRDRVWEMFYEYVRRAVKLVLFRGDAALLAAEEFTAPVLETVSVLYEHEDYGGEILDRLRFIADRALAAAKPGDHDGYSPLDTLQSFRRMLGAHLWMHEELDRSLKKYVDNYACAIRNELRKVEFEQSRYDNWESHYLYCERRYHQILNRIGEVERPAGPAIYSQRSAWEIRRILRADHPAWSREPADPRRDWRWRDVAAARRLLNTPSGPDAASRNAAAPPVVPGGRDRLS